MRKLNLVLDLDHTLVHSCRYDEDQYSLGVSVSGQGNMMFKFGSFMTKLRPFVHEFLKEVSAMFNLYICTKGNAFYAKNIVQFLDPHHHYFTPYHTRVFSKEDCLGPQKSLNFLMDHEESTIILDDTLEVWPGKDRDNLILMPKYVFFGSDCPVDEIDKNGALACVLKQLKNIYSLYFYYDPNDDLLLLPDVRNFLKIIRGQVLTGCNIFFSRSTLPNESESDLYFLWDMAEELGAVCLEQFGPSVTHVLSTSLTTQEPHWDNIFIVTPNWIVAAFFSWQKQPEIYYPPLLSI